MKFRDAYIYVRLRNREDTYQRRDYGKCEIDVTIQRWLMIIYLPIDRIIVFRQMDQRQAISINHNFPFFLFFLFFLPILSSNQFSPTFDFLRLVEAEVENQYYKLRKSYEYTILPIFISLM